MKKLFFTHCALLFLSISFTYSQVTVTDEYVQHEIEKGKQYLVVILKSIPQPGISEDSMADEQEAHLKYLFTLKEKGKLPVFGPFFNSGDLEGLCIFNSDNTDEVKRLIEGDPHVKAGHLTYEIHPWFGIPGYSLP